MSFVYPKSRRKALAQFAALLAGACASTVGSQPAKQQLVPLADMHTHLGRKTRANLPLDLAEEMRANNVLLAAWAYSTDHAYIEARPDGHHQKSEPDATKIWVAMRNELRTSTQYAKSAGLGVVLTAKDVDRAVSGLPSVVIAAEGTDFMQGRMGLLDEVFDGGLRHLQLVHYTLNAAGDIQTEAPRHGGLSDFGRELVRKAQAKGMLVDLAHSTEAAVGHALAVASKPMVWSHGWVDESPGAYDDRVGWLRRRLSLATARKIADAGGVVGIWGLGLKKPNRQWPVGRDDPQGYAKVIRSLINQLGVDHVAIGTDLSGVGDSGSVNSYADVRRVVQALQNSGLDEAAVAKVSYQNYARVLRASLA